MYLCREKNITELAIKFRGFNILISLISLEYSEYVHILLLVFVVGVFAFAFTAVVCQHFATLHTGGATVATVIVATTVVVVIVAMSITFVLYTSTLIFLEHTLVFRVEALAVLAVIFLNGLAQTLLATVSAVIVATCVIVYVVTISITLPALVATFWFWSCWRDVVGIQTCTLRSFRCRLVETFSSHKP